MAITRDKEVSLILQAIDEMAHACRLAGVLDDDNLPGLTYVHFASERIRNGERPDPAMPASPAPRPNVIWREPTTNRMIDSGYTPSPREPRVSPGTNRWRDLEEERAAQLCAKQAKRPLTQRLRDVVK